MYESPFRKGLPWLVIGLLLLLVSAVLYVYDQNRTNEEIFAEVEASIQRDFLNCLAYYAGDTLPDQKAPLYCKACELGYSDAGFLSSWTQNNFLPVQTSINRLMDLPSSTIISFGNRTYYQIRKSFKDSTSVILIPIHVTYRVSNDFLLPYFFLGKLRDRFYGVKGNLYAKSISFSIDKEHKEVDISVSDLRGSPVFQLSNVSVSPFRNSIRYTVMGFLILGALFLGVYLRIYSLHHWSQRYFINGSLFIGVLLFRGLMYFLGIPGDYWDMELFSSKILAFHDFFAPSLGEMTINILTIAILAWILYTYLFRINNWVYRKIMSRQFLVWPAMMITIFISSLLLEKYVSVFMAIIFNSQVEIDFSNLFKADMYSFLILLDVGLLLLAVSLVVFLLLKLNVLYGRRYGFSPLFIAIQLLAILVCNMYLHQHVVWSWQIAITLSVGLALLGLMVIRAPFKLILHHDLLNYLIIIFTFSIIVTHNVIKGQEMADKDKARRIAAQVLGSQLDNTIANFMQFAFKLEDSTPAIQAQRNRIHDMNQFRDWLVETFLRPVFKEFEIRVFMFDSAGVRLEETRDISPSFPPNAEVPLRELGDSVAPRLYQLPYLANRYIDMYGAELKIPLDRNDTANKTLISIELLPDERETEGLYPSLTLDEDVYNDIKLISSCDHAIYRDGFLHYNRGKTPFPIFNEEYIHYDGMSAYSRTTDEFNEYIEPIGNSKLVVVRYDRIGWFDILSTFSFIFYFFILATIIVIGIPVLGLRSLRTRRFSDELPLRAKIRMGLLVISILPMIVIITLLSPFISDRYNADAEQELREEAGRITQAIGKEFISLRNDPFSRLTSLREFQKRVDEMKKVIENDINIYDEDGKHLASTQPLIFESGINTDLMDAEAFSMLRKGQRSDYVHTEQVGEQKFLSAYKPIIGNSQIPMGYVNVPYLAKQDQLREQIIEFLAYLANIYLLVFLLINVVAVLVSSTITQPLAMIQQRLSSTSLGNVNEPIIYDSKDEIGAIVSAYNQMVDQLGESEEKLTQSQRELAWRQMARQVAHEIKNPLTPMKLSIQHLNRAWDEQTPRLQKMFPKVMKTLLSQIESMVRIANSFSEFAKMPEPINSYVLVNDVLLEVVDLYTQSEEAIWLIDIPQEEFWAYADREQLSRCFTNIIKNGLQAIGDNGIIHVSMRIMPHKARIEIKDNGKGMSEEVQKRVFEPNFSTKTSGMGLGLAIVKRIIEHSGGIITFESELGKGTTFIIELPAIQEQNLIPTN